MASKYTSVIQELLNSKQITKNKANEMMSHSRKRNLSQTVNIIRNRKRGLPNFIGSKLTINKTRNNRQNKLKNRFIGNYTTIKISPSGQQCYARTTLFVLLLYINRSANSLREFLKVVDSNFMFEPFEVNSPNEENKIKREKINLEMTQYFNNERNKELVKETFIQMYNNSKLFNSERENKILRDYFKYWRLKIEIIKGATNKGTFVSNNHILYEIKQFFGRSSYVVFIVDFIENVPFFNSLIFYNYNTETSELSIKKKGESFNLNELEKYQLYYENAPVLVGTKGHQNVAVNNVFFDELNLNNWPKYTVEQNHHNNGGMAKRNEVPKEEFTPNIQGLINEGSISLEQARFMMNDKRKRNQRKRNQKLKTHLESEVNSGKLPNRTAVNILERNIGAAANRGANRVRPNCRCTITGGKK